MHPGELPGGAEPVASKCTTSEEMSCRAIFFSAGAISPAVFRAAAASAPGEGAQPASSASAWQARSRNRNWPCRRYTPAPMMRGPYCTGCRHCAWGLRLRFLTAAAQQREQLVLGHGRPDRRDVDDLPALHPGHGRAFQAARSQRGAPHRCRERQVSRARAALHHDSAPTANRQASNPSQPARTNRRREKGADRPI
jgi:hypothetical protein